jgi:4-coumarate--CoA ligase
MRYLKRLVLTLAPRATCSVIGWDPNEKATSNAVGELNPNCEAMIMSDDGRTEITARGPDARGELWVRAPNVMKGYWRNPKATKETKTPDGWLKTGDIAYVDADGKFYIVDRKKELIKVKGNQVAPAELEALLLDHPAIADAAVIGLQTADGDERPRAYVVLQANAKYQGTPKEEIVQFVETRVTGHKRITGGVMYLDAIPKNPSGKILRTWLKEQASKETKEAAPRL